MFKAIQTFVVILTALMVMVMQAVGVSAGYQCGCTGLYTPIAECHAEDCHPHHAHADDCDEDHHHEDEAADRHHEATTTLTDDEPHEHEHSAVWQPFEVTTFSMGLDVPAVIYFTLCSDYLLAPERVTAPALAHVALRPRPPNDTGPPLSLLIIETTVLLV
jgi:hypothetical protein